VALMQRVVSARFPYLPLRVQIGPSSQAIEALLDTGFDGALVVPPDSIPDAELPADYHSWTLAAGSTVTAAAYLGIGQIGTLPPFAVLVTALGDEPLVGRGASDRFSITLDHGQRVIIEP
jgi:predicted aspartyl protease